MRAPSAILLVIACTSCVDIELLAPNRPADAELFLSWRLTQDTATAIELRADFWPGADLAGVPLPPEAELHVDGQPVPATTSVTGRWSYTWSRAVAPGAVSTSLVPMLIPGRGATVAERTLQLPVMQRAGPMLVTLAAGDDLRLPLSEPVTVLPSSASSKQWSLTFGSDCRTPSQQALQTSVRADPPAEIVIPSQWLQHVQAGTTSVCFQYFTFYRSETPYRVNISRIVEIEWRVTVQGTP